MSLVLTASSSYRVVIILFASTTISRFSSTRVRGISPLSSAVPSPDRVTPSAEQNMTATRLLIPVILSSCTIISKGFITEKTRRSFEYQLKFLRINHRNVICYFPGLISVYLALMTDSEIVYCVNAKTLKKKKLFPKGRAHVWTCMYVYRNVAQSFFDSNFPSSKPINSAYLHITRSAYNALVGE